MTKSKILDFSDRTNMFYWQTDRKITAAQIKKIFLNRRVDFDPKKTKKAISYGMQQAGKSKKAARVVYLGKPIKFGSVNNVVRATLADKTKVVIRMHPPKVKNGYFWAESIATKKARKFGVPVYKTYFVYDLQKKFNFDFMIMEALPGKTMQQLWPLDKKLDRKLIEETGRYAALIHKVNPRGFGFFKNKIAKEEGRLVGQYKTFKEHIFAALENNLKFLVDYQVFTIDQSKKVKKIFNQHLNLIQCKKPSLIHNDIADWNQLSDGKHVTGLVDWDECFSGDPVMDFAQWSLFFDNKRLKHFIRGYKQISKLPENYQEKDHLFRLRYLVSKMALRKKRLLVEDSEIMKRNMARAMKVMKEELRYFAV